MKLKLFSLATLLSVGLYAQNFQPFTTRYGKPLNDARYDSVYYRGLNGNPDSIDFFNMNKRTNIVYNSNHLEVSEIEQAGDWGDGSGAWTNAFKYTFTYDANKRWVGKTIKIWNGSGWDNYQKYVITYNSNNKETSTIYKSWIESTGSWDNFEKDSIIYDGAGNILEAIHYGWNSWNNDWGYDNKWTYTYTGNVKVSAIYSTYDGSNWSALGRYTYSYTGANNDFILVEYWTGQSWLKTGKYSYEFNQAGQVTKETLRSQKNGLWSKTNVKTFSYSPNGILKKRTHKIWFSPDSDNFSGDQQQYYLHHPQPKAAMLASSWADEAKNEELVIYPNPSNGVFSVKFTTNEQIKTIQVFNTIGEKILEQSSSEVSLENIAKGIYFVKVYNGENVYQKKIIVE